MQGVESRRSGCGLACAASGWSSSAAYDLLRTSVDLHQQEPARHPVPSPASTGLPSACSVYFR